MRILSNADAHGYRSAFSEGTEGAKPYEYSESTAAVFPDENAAQSALNRQTAAYQGPNFEDVPARDLGDDRYAALIDERSQPQYIYFWRTGILLQLFYLVWNGPPASEDTARRFVDQMDALTE